MNWDLPKQIKIGEKEYHISLDCDFRMILDCFDALNDFDLEERNRIECALIIFYEEINSREDIYYNHSQDEISIAIKEMFKVMNCGEEENNDSGQSKPRMMDWKHDFKYIAPAVSRVLGYDIRTPEKYTHWWTFMGAYLEIGECTWSTILSIRKKRIYGKKLEKWERDFYRENKKDIDLPQKITTEEEDWLNSDW